MKPTFIMMIGLPASGKSYIAEKLKKDFSANIHSSDAIREELSGDINNQDINTEVFNLLHKRVKEDLQNGKSCIYDATNLNYKRRKAFLDELKKIYCDKYAYLCATPYEICIERNHNRDRSIPDYVIEKFYKSFTPPYWYEGWDAIEISYGENLEFANYYGNIKTYIDSLFTFNQDNYHHNLSLGMHCNKAMELVKGLCWKEHNCIYLGEYTVLSNAALAHDIGKVDTKTFKNSKGEITDIAHYYSHEHVGSYKSLFFEYEAPTNILDTSVLINWHMTPYFWEKDSNIKMQEKYKKLWGKDLYSDIMILHEADKYAH